MKKVSTKKNGFTKTIKEWWPLELLLGVFFAFLVFIFYSCLPRNLYTANWYNEHLETIFPMQNICYETKNYLSDTPLSYSDLEIDTSLLIPVEDLSSKESFLDNDSIVLEYTAGAALYGIALLSGQGFGYLKYGSNGEISGSYLIHGDASEYVSSYHTDFSTAAASITFIGDLEDVQGQQLDVLNVTYTDGTIKNIYIDHKTKAVRRTVQIDGAFLSIVDVYDINAVTCPDFIISENMEAIEAAEFDSLYKQFSIAAIINYSVDSREVINNILRDNITDEDILHTYE